MKLYTVEKSLKIIELLNNNPQGLSLLEMTNRIGFSKSTIHHILNTLLPYAYIAKDPETKKYPLGFKFLEISRTILDNLDVRKIANKYLRQLHEECKEAPHLGILRDGHIVYIDKIDTPGRVSLATYIGFRTDPHAAAGGKVLLSELSHKEIMHIYKERSLKAYGRNTIKGFPRLFEELEKIRKQGYAIDDEEYYEGVRCVAAPIRAGRKIIAALSITGSIFTMTMERIDKELIGLVMKAAEEISSEMQW